MAHNLLITSLFILISASILHQAKGNARNIKLVAMNGNQYWVSASSPYAPLLNFHLAYQYCRTLGLQLVALESKEEVDILAHYLNSLEGNKNNGPTKSSEKFWTSANKLGSESSWIWMSSGEQLNSSFAEYWLNRQHVVSTNGAPKKQCMGMRVTTAQRTIFSPEECSQALPFICEQLRCVYYNYQVSPFPPEQENENPDLNGRSTDFGEIPAPGASSPSPRHFSNSNPSESTLRANHYITASNTLNFLASQTHLEGPSIRRRITLRPQVKLKGPDLDKYLSYQHPVFRHSLRTSTPGIPTDSKNISSLAPTHPTLNFNLTQENEPQSSQNSPNSHPEIVNPENPPSLYPGSFPPQVPESSGPPDSSVHHFYNNPDYPTTTPLSIPLPSPNISIASVDPDEFWRNAQNQTPPESPIQDPVEEGANSYPTPNILVVLEGSSSGGIGSIGGYPSSRQEPEIDDPQIQISLEPSSSIPISTEPTIFPFPNTPEPSYITPEPNNSTSPLPPQQSNNSGEDKSEEIWVNVPPNLVRKGYEYPQPLTLTSSSSGSPFNYPSDPQTSQNEQIEPEEEAAQPSEPKENKVRFFPGPRNIVERVKTFQFNRGNSPISWARTKAGRKN